MTAISIIIVCALACYYTIILSGLIWGIFQLNPGQNQSKPLVSVVIAARNEEDNIGKCLEALIRQDYPRDKYEIVAVNDRSEDGTAAVIDGFIQTDSRIQQMQITEVVPEMTPKKWALHTGIQNAKGEIILTTDADCQPGPSWISSIVAHFDDRVGLVAGYSPLNRIPSPSIFHRLIQLDGLALAGVAAGSFGMRIPLTCNGRNLAYRKSVYEEAGGFHSIGQFVSGDDDLLLHQIRSKTVWEMRYAVNKASMVPSRPPMSIRDFFHQRIRHASKGRHYPFPLTLSLIAVYLFNLMLLAALFFVTLWPLPIILWGLKSMLEFVLILCMGTRVSQTRVLIYFPLAMLLHIPYVVIFGLLGQIGRFKWKDDSFRTKKRRTI